VTERTKICAGIDAGSRAVKVVVMEAAGGKTLASRVADQGVRQEAVAEEIFDAALGDAGIGRDDVSRVVATGYGRHGIGFADEAITEITCHARGVSQLVPEARTVVDIGGQDSKLIRLDRNGAVRDFVMNDRCAAGTGCFLEVVARKLDLALDELGDVAARSTKPATISSMCVVFAETEIIGLLAAATPREDIVAGVQIALVTRLASMAGTVTEPPVVFTGGVALIAGMAGALENALDRPIIVAPDPQLTGALGAALLAGGR